MTAAFKLLFVVALQILAGCAFGGHGASKSHFINTDSSNFADRTVALSAEGNSYLRTASYRPLVAQSKKEDDYVGFELGDEYKEHAKPRGSGSGGGGRRRYGGGSSGLTARSVLLYLPNRLLDFVDIFRFDVGVGPAWGVVGRVTKYGQIGYREFSPASFRLGLRGRRLPFFVERSSEFGVGPGFVRSHDRGVTPAEIGAGADLFIAGVYLGLSFDQLADFLLGWFGPDFPDDDL